MKERFDFGRAVQLVKAGKKATRSQWYERKGEYIELNRGIFDFVASAKQAGIFEEEMNLRKGSGFMVSIAGMPPELFSNMETSISVFPSIQKVITENNMVIAYMPLHEDILAEDWYEYEK